MLFNSCSSVLEEEPKTLYTPDFFTTPAGVEGGISSLYAHLRDLYGPIFPYNIMMNGTDEATFGSNSDINFKVADLSNNGELNSSTSNSSTFWNFTYINTANGIIENAEAVGLDASLIAEVRFLRALFYFNQVRIFGGVPLDLGSGELKFNTTPVRTSVRNTVPEVYSKCIFPDLKFALENLPETGRATGTVTKTAARMVLANAYLTYAWWLENPNDIPTYPLCDRVDPDGKSYQQYFQMAYDMALEAINNPGPFGLESSYYKVYLGSNDRNKEQVLYADHTEESTQYNRTGNNYASWVTQWNYPTMVAIDEAGRQINPVLRTDNQFLGRPWWEIAPTHYALSCFTDRDKDSRYDGSFTWLYRTNWKLGGGGSEYVLGPHGNEIGMNEPFLVFLNEDDPTVEYTEDIGTVIAGVSPNYDYFVITPSGSNRTVFPGLWKHGPYRTNTTGTGLPNDNSTRPFPILKFSNLYFIAAEAAVKGATGPKSARELVNVLRARAGKWEFKNNEQEVYVADFSEELTAATPEVITIDWLLDEMIRENYGDGFRWLDLTRTQTWIERASEYTISGYGKADHTPEVTKRTIEKYHYLRPVPKSQIDRLRMSDEEKAAYQNPGYVN